MDTYVLKSSVSPSKGKDLVFEKKEWVAVVDSNGSSYTSGRVTFNLDNIANSGSDYFNASETYVSIPLNLAVEFKNTTDATHLSASDVGNMYCASLKSGAYQIIDKINYKLNGNEIITLDNFENVKINYRLLTTWSGDNVQKRGGDLHFGKDSCDSAHFDALMGSANNKLIETVFSPLTATSARHNAGRVERMMKTSYTGYGSVTADELTNSYIDTVIVTAPSSSVKVFNFQILAQFRLGDLHPMFQNMPLVKSPSQYLSLTLNTNSVVSHTVTAGDLTGYSVQSATNTLPYMLSPISNNSDSGCKVTTKAGVIKSCISVSQVPTSTIAGSIKHKADACYFHACFVKLSPDDDLAYSKDSVKEVVYEECYAQSGGNLSNIASNGKVNQLISGSFPKLRKCVIMPFINADSNGTAKISPLQSTYSCEPATVTPFYQSKACDDMNVRVGTSNVYPKNIQYSYENWLETASSINAINGGMSEGISSGLLSRHEWETAYGFRTVDLSRHPEVNDSTAQQISVTCKNATDKMMDYIVLVFYEKSFMIDTQRGLVVSPN